MKLKFISFTMIAAVLTLGWGCSKSDGDDDTGSTQPEPEQQGGISNHGRMWYPVDFENDWHITFSTGNESRPDWKAPSAQDYETWMIYQLSLPENFTYWASADDMMAVFIDGKIRAAASPAYDTHLDNTQKRDKFILKIMGDYEYSSTETVFTYKYYNARLKKTFSEDIYERFIPEQVKGVEEPYTIKGFTNTSPWAVATTIQVVLPEDLTQHIYSSDKLAVFVGNECRGLYAVDGSKMFFDVYGNKTGETGTLYFYREELGATKLTPDIELNGAFMTVPVDGVETIDF